MSLMRRTLLLSRDLLGIRSRQLIVRQIAGLSEVGKLEAIKVGGNYDTGQMFLHKVFGYRGVVLFPWLARVYDRDNVTELQLLRNTNPLRVLKLDLA